MFRLTEEERREVITNCDHLRSLEFSHALPAVFTSKSIRKPHYMTATEQANIEFNAPGYLRNAIVILTEMGLRPFKELMPMKKSQVDLENAVVHISDSKTPSRIETCR